MNEQVENAATPAQHNDTNIMVLLKKIQQQLSFVEQKLDTLIGRSSDRPFKERHFSKPFRPGGFNRSREDRPREFSEGNKDRPHSGPERGRKAFFQRKMSKFHKPHRTASPANRDPIL